MLSSLLLLLSGRGRRCPMGGLLLLLADDGAGAGRNFLVLVRGVQGGLDLGSNKSFFGGK